MLGNKNCVIYIFIRSSRRKICNFLENCKSIYGFCMDFENNLSIFNIYKNEATRERISKIELRIDKLSNGDLIHAVFEKSLNKENF